MDGELTAEEARELAELRSASDEAGPERALESEIRELGAELARVEDVAVPPDLGPRVLASIERSRPAVEPLRFRKPEAASTARPAVAAGGWGSWRRWGYLAAGLAIVGLAVFQLAPGRPGPEDSSELAGTLAPLPDAGETPGLEGRPGAGMPESVRLARGDGRLLASLAPGAGDSVFEFHAPDLELEHVEFVDGARGTYEEAPGRITLRMTGPGRVEARLLLGQPDRPFRVSASGGGFGSFDEELYLSRLLER